MGVWRSINGSASNKKRNDGRQLCRRRGICGNSFLKKCVTAGRSLADVAGNQRIWHSVSRAPDAVRFSTKVLQRWTIIRLLLFLQQASAAGDAKPEDSAGTKATVGGNVGDRSFLTDEELAELCKELCRFVTSCNRFLARERFVSYHESISA